MVAGFRERVKPTWGGSADKATRLIPSCGFGLDLLQARRNRGPGCLVIKSDNGVGRPEAGEQSLVKVFEIESPFLSSIVINPDTVGIVRVR